MKKISLAVAASLFAFSVNAAEAVKTAPAAEAAKAPMVKTETAKTKAVKTAPAAEAAKTSPVEAAKTAPAAVKK